MPPGAPLSAGWASLASLHRWSWPPRNPLPWLTLLFARSWPRSRKVNHIIGVKAWYHSFGPVTSMQSHDISALLWTYSLPSHIHHCQLLYRHVHEALPPAFSSSKLAGSINPHPIDIKSKAHLWLTWSPCALFWVNLELSFQFLKVRGYTSLVKKSLFLYSSLLKQRPGLSYGYWPQCVIVSLLKMNLFPSRKSSFLILRVCDGSSSP